MIIETKNGDILSGNEKRIAFAINTEGINDGGFARVITKKYWPELTYIPKTELGTVLIKKVDNIEFFALTCHSLKKGWNNQQEIIQKCFDAIPGDEPIASISIGRGYIGVRDGADFSQIKAGMEASKKKIILYQFVIK